MSYTSKRASRAKAVGKESSLSSARVEVPNDRARTLLKTYGRPRGMYSAGKMMENGSRMRDGREIGRWNTSGERQYGGGSLYDD
jgi:hypothetical protein